MSDDSGKRPSIMTSDIVIPDSDGNGETIVSLSNEELAIIDFINDRLIQSELNTKLKLKDEIIDKYGEAGTKVWTMLMEEELPDGESFDEECEDCGQISEEWLDKVKLRMDQMDIFFDDKFDSVVNNIMNDCSGRDITDKDIYDELVKTIDGYSQGDDIPTDEINKVKMKILYSGITDGWLLDEYFNK